MCRQSSFVWQQLFGDNRNIVFDQMAPTGAVRYDEDRGYRLFKRGPLDYASVETVDHVPVYFPLPDKFLGDRVNSYNGFIRYKITNYGRDNMHLSFDERIWDMFPIAVLIGNHRIVLEYYARPGVDDIPENGRFKLRIREDGWRSRTTPQVPVTRRQMMVALQNVQEVYLRGAFVMQPRRSVISDMSWDIAVPGGNVSQVSPDYKFVGQPYVAGSERGHRRGGRGSGIIEYRPWRRNV